MSKHSIIKAGLGIGLMASSLASMATNQTFAEPMVFYKVNGSAVNYVAILPNITDTAVLALELYQSSTVSTWAFAAGGAVGAGAGGPVWGVKATVAAYDSVSEKAPGTVNVTRFDGGGVSVASDVTVGTGATGSQVVSHTWYGGGTASVSMSFAQVLTISSQACNVTFNAEVGTNGIFKYGAMTIKPSGFPSASSNVTYRVSTTSGASSVSTTSTASMASGDWNGYNFTATSNFPTYSAYSVPVDGNAGNTVAVSVLTRANLCTNVYTAKSALNAAGNVIGGAEGMIRLW